MPEITEQPMALQITNVACALKSATNRSMRRLACKWRAPF
jgi:hypothetical protein